MKIFTLSATLLAAASVVSAHMEMSWPPPLRSKHNSLATTIDYDMISPLSADGSNYPCKGYLSLLGTPDASPVATWTAGESYNMTIEGGANHNGGSCQASLSFDGGKTFTVLKSYVGGCPPGGSSSWDFTLPVDTPSSDNAIFAWTWFNQVGNREMYMNCAVVSTKGGPDTNRQSSTAFSSRPEIFIANVANGCSTLEGSDVEFPNPGPDVSKQNTLTSPPSGSCGSSGSPTTPEAEEVPEADGSASSGSSTTLTVPTLIAPTGTAQTTQTTTLPGGVFIPQPTTIVTVSTTRATSVQPPVANSTAGAGVGGGNTIGANTPWTRCSNEGAFNCVGGTRFQRCAAGLWSPFIPTAPGTKCQPGSRNTLVIVKKRHHARSFLA